MQLFHFVRIGSTSITILDYMADGDRIKNWFSRLGNCSHKLELGNYFILTIAYQYQGKRPVNEDIMPRSPMSDSNSSTANVKEY